MKKTVLEQTAMDGGITSTIRRAVKNIAEQEYSRELARQTFKGEGCFLDKHQVDKFQENLEKAVAMVRLVAGSAENSLRDAPFCRDARFAMTIALVELEKIGQAIYDNYMDDLSKFENDSTHRKEDDA